MGSLIILVAHSSSTITIVISGMWNTNICREPSSYTQVTMPTGSEEIAIRIENNVQKVRTLDCLGPIFDPSSLNRVAGRPVNTATRKHS
jgi:hypothetical protein